LNNFFSFQSTKYLNGAHLVVFYSISLLNKTKKSFENEPIANESDLDSDLEEYEEIENDEIDKMLEKPIDVLNEKDDVNFYTYDKVQIKSE
jgi:hypothetical protein